MNEYRWLTNLYCPFDNTDKAYLTKLEDYKIGAPQRAMDDEGQPTPTALTLQQLQDFNIVGIYTTETALRRHNPDKITQQMARKSLTVVYSPLEGPLSSYLDEACHFTGPQ